MLFEHGLNPLLPESVPSAVTTTANGGLYRLEAVPGSYFTFIPPSAFAATGPLAYTLTSEHVDASLIGDEGVGEETRKKALIRLPVAHARQSWSWHRAPCRRQRAAEQTGVGSDDDNGTADNDVDLTVDLGFKPKQLCVGNLVFKDQNGNGRYDGSDAGVAGVKVEVLLAGTNPELTTSTRWSTVTEANGSCRFARRGRANTLPGFRR